MGCFLCFSRVMALREHAGWVTSVFLQKGGDGNIISGRYHVTSQYCVHLRSDFFKNTCIEISMES